MHKICVVTGTRAEYGLLKPLMDKIKSDAGLQLQLIVTGTHLSPEFGLTYKQIEEDGFVIDEKVEMLLSSDTSVGIVKSMGLCTIAMADALQKLNPNLLVILGDRYEMLAVAQSALIMQIPIAHIAGGECTFGAYDDSIRHSISKMSTWHFVATEEYKKRVIQLGESPKRVFNVGAPGIENTLKLSLFSKEQVYKNLKLYSDKPLLLITLHPETNNETTSINNLLTVLNKYERFNIIFTKSNADNGGHYINNQIKKYCEQYKNAKLYDSLGQLLYLSTVKYADVVIGNSSSGLVEVPYLRTPTVDIGNRQEGRLKPSSVINCDTTIESIDNAIHRAFHYDGKFERLFGKGETSTEIIKIIKQIQDFSVKKEFYDI